MLHAAQNWDIFLTFQHWKMSSRLRQINKLFLFKGELHSNDIFLHFALIGLECDSITLFTKINFFCLLKLTLQHHLHKIYMAFYLLTWTYFNDVNGGRNILINSQLKSTLFMNSDKENWNKIEKANRKDMKITAMKVTLVKMRYQI